MVLPGAAGGVDVSGWGEPRQAGGLVEVDPPLRLLRLQRIRLHQPMMERAQQNAVGQARCPALPPRNDVMRLTRGRGGGTAGEHTPLIPLQQRRTQRGGEQAMGTAHIQRPRRGAQHHRDQPRITRHPPRLRSGQPVDAGRAEHAHRSDTRDQGVVVEREVDLRPVHPMRGQRPPARGVLSEEHQRVGPARIPAGRPTGVGVRGGRRHQRVKLRRQQRGIRHRELARDPHRPVIVRRQAQEPIPVRRRLLPRQPLRLIGIRPIRIHHLRQP